MNNNEYNHVIKKTILGQPISKKTIKGNCYVSSSFVFHVSGIDYKLIEDLIDRNRVVKIEDIEGEVYMMGLERLIYDHIDKTLQILFIEKGEDENE